MIKQNNKSSVNLGCGLIRVGRVWGVDNKPVPSESDALTFLEGAFELGIRFFDTAPAYGLSEKRLGAFLKNLTSEQRSKVTVATKFGEHWDPEKQESFVDHTYEMLMKSFEKSMNTLERIDVLQLHKASASLLQSENINHLFSYALKSGVSFLGASVSDSDTGLKACSDRSLNYIQLPFNEERMELITVIKNAKRSKKKVLFNRPFAMGAVTKQLSMISAYKRIIDLDCPGVILTGTASLEHLKQNINNFQRAMNE